MSRHGPNMSPEEAKSLGLCGAGNFAGCEQPAGHRGAHVSYFWDWPNGCCSNPWGYGFIGPSGKKRFEEDQEDFQKKLGRFK